MAYPVTVSVEPAPEKRNRLTTACRLFLAIPHVILVGSVGFSVAYQQNGGPLRLGSETGLLGAAAVFLAIVSWFTIVIRGTHLAEIRQFTAFYLRWRLRALAYLMLLEDAYPPFGDAPYPASLDISDPVEPRDRLAVGVRLFLVIPHIVVLLFVTVAWCLMTIVAWFAIIITGEYPRGLYAFGVGALRWRLRVEAYMLLLVDEYPPFSLE